MGAVGGSGGPGLAADHAEEVTLEVFAETAEKKNRLFVIYFMFSCHFFIFFYICRYDSDNI